MAHLLRKDFYDHPILNRVTLVYYVDGMTRGFIRIFIWLADRCSFEYRINIFSEKYKKLAAIFQGLKINFIFA